jgi:hypothetical membrane protein
MMIVTKRLLLGGVVGGPLFVVVGLARALTRHGFDLTRQALSLLTLGSAGWIQTVSFLVTGALAMAFATGMRRVLRDRPGGTWGPRLLYVYGAGLIVGGLFHPDAGDGFPPGTPSGQSVVRTWHGALHQTGGMLAFLALLATCFVLARYYRSWGQAGRARAAQIVGAGFLACVMGSAAPGGSLTLFIGVAAAMLWMALVATQLIASRSRALTPAPRRDPACRQAAHVTPSLGRAAELFRRPGTPLEPVSAIDNQPGRQPS